VKFTPDGSSSMMPQRQMPSVLQPEASQLKVLCALTQFLEKMDMGVFNRRRIP
jgi:hypothetical protein